MNASAIKDLHYEWYLKILSNLHKPSGDCNLKEFSDITRSVSKSLIYQGFLYDYSFIIWLRKSWTLVY